MSYFKFKEEDVFYNRVKAHPENAFFIHSGTVYYAQSKETSGSFSATERSVPRGFVSLYELNIDRNGTTNKYIYPFITKDGTIGAFKTVSTSNFNTQFSYGDRITGSYRLSASLSRTFIDDATDRRQRLRSIRTSLDNYTRLSPRFAISGVFGDKLTSDVNMISVPSIFYGSAIKKGSVSLKYYITGTVIAELQDSKNNGELIQVSGTTYAQSFGSGACAGIVLYKQGIILLTGSWALETGSRDYLNQASADDYVTSSWLYWGTTMTDDGYTMQLSMEATAYSIDFKGTNFISTMTLFAKANQQELNHSNNLTFYKHGQTAKNTTSSFSYIEDSTISIKNIVSTSYAEPTGAFQKETYITKIGIYDENKNLIGITNLSKPMRKLEDRDYIFKLKLDI
jgi:hypothetical protein